MLRVYCIAATLTLAIGLAGCLTPSEGTPINQYLIIARPEVPQAQPLPLTLGIRELEPARPYNISMARIDADGRLSYYNQSSWGDYPAAAVTRALRDAIGQTGRFSDTGMAEQMARPDLMLVGYLNGFHEDLAATPSQAVVEVRLELREARGTALHWAATLREVEPIATPGAAGLTTAINTAVQRLVAKAATDIAAVQVAGTSAPTSNE